MYTERIEATRGHRWAKWYNVCRIANSYPPLHVQKCSLPQSALTALSGCDFIACTWRVFGVGGLKTIIFRPQALELAREEDGAAASLAASGNVHRLVNGGVAWGG